MTTTPAALAIAVPDALPALCRRFHVRRLDLFGSAVDGGRFDQARSDLDFLVAFEEMPSAAYAESYFGLREGLAGLFGRRWTWSLSPLWRIPIFAVTSRRSGGGCSRRHDGGAGGQIPLGRPPRR